jgi:hypothetical protein
VFARLEWENTGEDEQSMGEARRDECLQKVWMQSERCAEGYLRTCFAESSASHLTVPWLSELP